MHTASKFGVNKIIYLTEFKMNTIAIYKVLTYLCLAVQPVGQHAINESGEYSFAVTGAYFQEFPLYGVRVEKLSETPSQMLPDEAIAGMQPYTIKVKGKTVVWSCFTSPIFK